MAEHTISIILRTAADVRGAQEAAAAIRQVGEAAKGVDTAMTGAAESTAQVSQAMPAEAAQQAGKAMENLADKTGEAAKAMDQHVDSAKATADALDEAGEAAEGSRKATRDLVDENDQLDVSSRKVGAGADKMAQSVGGAASGLRGLAAGLPGLVGGLIGGAGIELALTIVTSAFDRFWAKLEKADWSGTWIGDLREKLDEATREISEQEEELQKLAEAPLSWIKKGADAYAAYAEVASRALQVELDKVREINDALKTQARLKAEAQAHELRLAQIRLPDMVADSMGTPEWAANEQKKLNLAMQEAEVMRTAKVDAVRMEETKRRNVAMGASEAATAQEDRVKGLKQREENNKAIATANLQKIDYEKRIKEIDDMERLATEAGAGMPGGMSVPYDDGGERERLRQAIAAQERVIKRAEERSAPLPIAGEGETVTSAEAKAQELRDAADKAAAAAEEARQALREAGIAARQSRELDQARAEERRQEITGAVLDRAQADAKEEAARKEVKVPTDNLTPAAPPSNAPRPEPQAQQDVAPIVADEVRGLGQRTSNLRAKAQVEQLAKDLEDGVSAQELERLRALTATLRQTSAQGMAEMASALDEFAAVVAAELGATRAAVGSLQGRISAMRGSAPGA